MGMALWLELFSSKCSLLNMCSDLHFFPQRPMRRTVLNNLFSIVCGISGQWRMVCTCQSACVPEAKSGVQVDEPVRDDRIDRD